MRIERLDPPTAGAATLAAYAALLADTRAYSSPDGLPPPAAWSVNRVRNVPANFVTAIWLVYDGDDLVAAAELFWWEAPDNRNRAWLHLDVPLTHQTDALLDALAGAAAEVATAAGRTLLNVETPAAGPMNDWVGRRGGARGSVEEHNVVRLATLDRADVAALAAAVPDGYELVAFDGATPDDLLAPYAKLVEAMNDAPRDALTSEDWVFTPERVRTWEAGLDARGHVVWTVIARETATGDLAGFNQLIHYPEWPEVVTNEDTAVVGRHRGHGLGLWIKSVNLLRVLDERPEAVCVETWNAASNTHMLRVNRRLGFVCEHVWASWELAADAVLAAPRPA